MANVETKIDVQALWNALSDDERRQVGVAALILAIGIRGSHEMAVPEQGFEAAEQAGANLLYELVERRLPKDRRLPDLSPLGVRACRVCGCTDDCACPEGCSWTEDDLCSSCSEGQREASHG